MRITLAVAVACLTLGGLAAAADATAAIRKETLIPAEGLGPALTTLAKVFDFQVLYRTEVVGKLRTEGVSGAMTASEALEHVLTGTGLTYKYLDDKTVTIMPVSTGDSGQSTPTKASGSPDDADTSKEAGKNTSQGFRLAQVDQGSSSRSSTIENNTSDPQDSSKKTELSEIIVTAEKREERIQDVPASLTVLSAANLENQGVSNFSDYMTLVPSLSDFSGGAQGHGAVILRGLNSGYLQTSNTVGYYVDDIPFSATSPLSVGALLTPDPDLEDIDHLEVLKGPQATLYGASNLGGIIKTVTKKPDLDNYTGELQLDGSSIDNGGDGYAVVGIANLPLIPGQLALRVSGFDRDFPGYMTNITLGSQDRDITRKEGGRLALRWAPTDEIDVQLNVFLQSLRVDGWNYEFVNSQTLVPLAGPYTYASAIDPSFYTTYRLYNLTLHYTAGSLGTLTNSTSYASYHDHEVEDLSPYLGVLNAYAPVPVPPNAAQLNFFGPSMNKFSEEIRFAAQRMGPFEWLAGLFYTDEKVNYLADVVNVIPPSPTPIPGPSSVLEGFSSPTTYKEQAAFADITYYFTDAIDFTLGGRYSHNQQDITSNFSGFLTPLGAIPGSTSGTDFSYLASLSYKLTSNVNTYARVSTAYRPGGPQLVPVPGFTSFKPDSLVNYELGIKSEWLERRLRSNLAVYYMDWKDVQLSFLDVANTEIANGGRATSKGVEYEGDYTPIQGLNFGVALAYTDAVLDSVSAGVTQATGAVAGNTLPYTPKWSGSATADYERPLTSTLRSNIGATFRYQGSKWSDYPEDPLNTGVIIPAYRTLDLRGGLKWDRYSAQLRVSNVFNEKGLDTVVNERVVPSNAPSWAAIIQPRTVTLSLKLNF